MKKQYLLLSLIFFYHTKAICQRLDLDFFGGISNYQGDLQPIFLNLTFAKPSGFVVLKYGITDNLFIRGGIALGSFEGSDAKNRDYLKPRNLHFKSAMQEVHLGLEYKFINPTNFSLTPYFFAGIAAYHFNPYTYYDGQKWFLQPIGTEGQGLPQYPDRQVYKLTQFSIPYGAGFKWQINCNFNVGVEFGQRKLFTDYLDDVSKEYASESSLQNAHGPLAVILAYRRAELEPGRPYPLEGTQRGNPKQNDVYYFGGITIGLKINDCQTGAFTLGGIFKPRPSRGSNTNCPKKVW